MSVGIKESLELLKGIKDLAGDAVAVFADGKVDVKDLGIAMALITQFGDLKNAVSGASQIPAELKDLDDEEIAQLAASALAIVTAFRAA